MVGRGDPTKDGQLGSLTGISQVPRGKSIIDKVSKPRPVEATKTLH